MEERAFLEKMPRHFVPEVVHSASGRANLIGEHTDYNGGFALPVVVPYNTFFALRRNGTKDNVSFNSLGNGESYMGKIGDAPADVEGWVAYLMGVVQGFVVKNAKIEGFDCFFDGDVPRGAGMSSSASFTCGLALGIDALFQTNFPKMELAKIGQWAEHHYVGTKCGLMDQITSLFGKENEALLIDFKKLEIKNIPIGFEDCEWFLINTNVHHSLASSAYNQRRNECEMGLSIVQKQLPNIVCLRDISKSELEKFAPVFSDTVYKRCLYVVEENERVLAAVDALSQKDPIKFGKLMYESHAGLRDAYEVSCKQLDFLVEMASLDENIFGSRMMGGGFGGCTINFAKKGVANGFFKRIVAPYYAKFNINPTLYII